ncbi:MAG: diguanylate cyclase [Thermoleophilia bacterium]|nr:diguanylate cyclase [Thermoleophilia bacterium]
MDDPHHTTSARPGAPPDATWAAAALRLRRLHRVQLVVLGVFCVFMVAVVAGSLGFTRAQEQRHVNLDEAYSEVADSFDRLRAVHTAVLERAGSITAADVAAVITARERLQAVQSAQGRDFRTNTEMDAGAEATIAQIDVIVGLSRSPANLLSQPDIATPLGELDAASTRWTAAMRTARQADARDAAAARGRLLTLTLLMVGLLGAAALLVWRGLGRARERLVGELRRNGAEQTAMTRIAMAAASGADVEELRRIAQEAVAEPLEGARVTLVHGDEADATRELAAAGTPAAGVLRRDVLIGDGAWGLLIADWDGADPPACAAARMDRLAGAIATAVEGSVTRRLLEARAVTDALTGLPNHGAFHDALAIAVAAADHDAQPMAVAVVDIDGLADVNAEWGHAAGDGVIAEVGRRLALCAEPDETLARVSGKAFAWIMPGHDALGAADRAHAARFAVLREAVPPAGRVTVSAGVADLEDAATGGGLMDAAGRALQSAKAAGRDAVRTHADTRDEAHDVHQREFAALRALARAVDLRDENTWRHSERVAEVSHRLALELGWDPARAARLRQAALVHDVGKVGVPDSVLLKPGHLTAEERRVVETHVTLGAQIVSEVLDAEQVGWVRGHHERIDGVGYPDRIPGHEIPDGARIMAVADTWDAMTADRVYRPGMPADAALRICREVAGTQLCQHCVNGLVVLFERGLLDDPGTGA